MPTHAPTSHQTCVKVRITPAAFGFTAVAIPRRGCSFRAATNGAIRPPRPRPKHSQFRACSDVGSDGGAGVFVDDPFGGFKGQRTSETATSWARSGTRLQLSESQRLFVSIEEPEDTVIEADVLVLPGFPCPSFLTRNMTERLTFLRPRTRVISLDWPGVGESDAPQDGIGFSYGVESAAEAVRKIVSNFKVGEGKSLIVVSHGYLGTVVGAIVAAEYNAVACVFLAPVVAGADATCLPKELKKLKNPLLGPLLSGNPAHMADKVFTSATPYRISEEDMMVLRSPFMRSGGPGFAARAIALNIDWRNAANRACEIITALECDVTFATAYGDRWLNVDKLKPVLDKIAAARKGSTGRIDWDYSGHFIFDDAPEDVAKLIAQTIQGSLP